MDKNLAISSIIESYKNANPENIISKLKITNYIPLREKANIARDFMFSRSMLELDIPDEVMEAIQLEIFWKFDILMEYTNVYVSDEDKTFDNYDVLESNGFFDFVIDYCEKDFKTMKKIVSDCIGVSDCMVVKSTINSIDVDAIKKEARMINKLLKNPEVLKDLSNIIDFNDPTYKELRDTVTKNK